MTNFTYKMNNSNLEFITFKKISSNHYPNPNINLIILAVNKNEKNHLKH